MIYVKLNLRNAGWLCETVTAGQDAIINSLHSDWLNHNPIPFSIMCIHLQQLHTEEMFFNE